MRNFGKLLVSFILVLACVFAVTACKDTEYTVSFDTVGGSAVESVTVKAGETVVMPENPTKEGFTFAGWIFGEAAWDPATAITADVKLVALWTENTTPVYNVTYIYGGDWIVPGITAQGGTTLEKPIDPSVPGHSFGGWYFGERLWNFSLDTVQSDMTLVAKWERNVYTVSFDTVGGTEIADLAVSFADTPVLPEAPTKANYTFAGWTLDGNLYAPAPLDKDITLKAVWLPAYCNVNFDTDGALPIASIGVKYGESFTLPANPTKEHYSFKGWTLNGTEFTTPGAVTSDITLKAVWERIVYTVSFDTDGAAAIEAIKVNSGELFTLPENPAKEHYTFGGWTLGAEKYVPAPVTSDITLKASWTVNVYTVIFNPEGEEPTVLEVNSGASVIPPKPDEKEGFAFLGWYDEDTLYNGGAVTSDLDLYEKWAPLYTVSFNPGNDSVIEPVKVKEGDTVTLPENPTKENFEFLGWYLNGKLYEGEKVESDIELVAEWIAVHTVEFDTDGGNAIDSLKVKDGEKITLPEDPTRAGFIFTGWTVNSLPFAEDTSITADTVIKANWAKKIIISFNTDGGSAVEQISVKEGEVPTLPAAPVKEGYAFTGWYFGDELYIPTPVTTRITLKAKWIESTKGLEFSPVTEDGETIAYEVKVYNGTSETVIIPAVYNALPVVAISEGAFKNSLITAVTIPDSVVVIGTSAFEACSLLTEINIGENTSLSVIGNRAFCGCGSIEAFNVPDTVTVIGDEAFAYCAKLTSVNFTENSELKVIGASAFSSDALIESFNVPASVESIGAYAFFGALGLKTLNFAENGSLEAIGTQAFYGTALESFSVPATVEFAGFFIVSSSSEAFSFTEYKNGYYIGTEDNPYYILFFVKDKTVTSFEMHRDTRVIADYTFADMKALETLKLEDKVVTIGNYAFYGAESLNTLLVSNDFTQLENIGDYAFFGCDSLETLNLGNRLESIGKAAFYGAKSLSEIEIPSTVVFIGDYAFAYCSALTGVGITTDSSLEAIGNYTFYMCASLEEFAFSKNLSSIGDYAFYNCSKLENVSFDAECVIESVGDYAFFYADKLAELITPYI